MSDHTPAPGRYSVLGLVFVSYLLCYMDRMVIASAVPFMAKDLGLDGIQTGFVLSAFFIGYAFMQFPGGILSDRYGPKLVIIISMLGWSVFTGLTGVVEGFLALVLVRIVFGLFEGAFPAAASKSIVLWFPIGEVGRANGVKLAATQLGPALAPPFVAAMLLLFGWRQVFYFLVIPGLVLACVVAVLMKDAPGHEAAKRSKAPATQWLTVLRSPALLMTATSLFFVNLGSWGLMNWIPSYLLEARGVSILKMGILAALPFVSGTAGYFVGGYVGDKFFADRRHLPIAVSLIVSAGFIVLVTMASTAEGATIMLMCAMFAMCIGLSGIFTLPMIISDVRVAGSALGMVNTAGQIAGFLSPLIIGTTLELSGRNYDFVLAGIATTFCLGSAAIWAVPVVMKRADRRSAESFPVS